MPQTSKAPTSTLQTSEAPASTPQTSEAPASTSQPSETPASTSQTSGSSASPLAFSSPASWTLWILRSSGIRPGGGIELADSNPLKLPLKKCAVVGNGGILRHSKCGRDIDQADFIMRCNVPPLTKEYVEDVGTRTHLVTANPSIIEKRFQNLLWSRKAFADKMKVYGSSFIYMPAFSMKPGTDPSLRAYYALADSSSNLTMLFANPEFLRSVGKFWKARGIHAKRLSTGLFLVSLALGLCDEVTAYGFWPFSVGLDKQPISHHYYDNILPYKWFHAMPEEFIQLWHLHKSGTLRMRVGHCPPQNEGS
ncbi:Alpha-N-acetylneuraminide alpha-2,8-sialyltransferase [Ilyodon furcidens]|uniref:Alpha-N-acetylneuraminide alpha-2,8-sialyltransferase n=2 Tax=Goodeidae TaxID=28758 RepID=A0ABV0UDL0_9TELE